MCERKRTDRCHTFLVCFRMASPATSRQGPQRSRLTATGPLARAAHPTTQTWDQGRYVQVARCNGKICFVSSWGDTEWNSTDLRAQGVVKRGATKGNMASFDAPLDQPPMSRFEPCQVIRPRRGPGASGTPESAPLRRYMLDCSVIHPINQPLHL